MSTAERAAARALFDKHVRAWPGCFTARLELDDLGKKTHGFEHCKTKVVFTKVLAPLEAREAATGNGVAGLASPRTGPRRSG